jgi:hypothetical protein
LTVGCTCSCATTNANRLNAFRVTESPSPELPGACEGDCGITGFHNAACVAICLS